MRAPDLPQARMATTLTLKVPRVDWAAVIAGAKTQFRACGRGYPTFDKVELPRPVVLYSRQPFRAEPETRIAVLENVYKEPLAAITDEGLAAEGVADLAEFRRYWIERHTRGGGFKPLAIVNVYCIALWQDDDLERFGDVFMRYFYGPWL